eukprot:1236625-Amphidinium_carterae.1
MLIWDDHFLERGRSVSLKCPDAEKNWIVQAWKMDPPVGDSSKISVDSHFPFRTIASPMSTCYLDLATGMSIPIHYLDPNKAQALRELS